VSPNSTLFSQYERSRPRGMQSDKANNAADF
jgi:hypothetical protein